MSKTILVVDDSATLRMSVEMTLSPAGFTVVQATNGSEGLQALKKMEQQRTQPDMIISDINMPIMDGIAFIKEVKKTSFKFVPILVLTTEREDSKKLEGKQAGASGWLVKPFKPDTLLTVVRKFTRSLA
ncbi:response regulator receiver protein [Desulfarculus baarsii DSM 2075]|uniref:Response regulator receiver protein n=1 Tax=Desulfarculus baarsii (strain ATCC 33931 / DSM 2075 / LMG 7858 / VKM B-1802 / 2st14) TaxID=644282 RepID=E1QFZ0_DESB2|nr:response regulator [Desulfarculus baarsii]ADK84600.1 response regulator receiver protein [Desulfarculus baarsii DSM 2075]